MSSMATEMGGIIGIFPPNQSVIDYCSKASGKKVEPVFADSDASYDKIVEIDVDELGEQISKPGHPEDVTDIKDVVGQKIGSAFIGSCTNGRFEDMKIAADILKGNKVAPGVVLKIVPSTDVVWKQCLKEGLIEIFKNAGALVSNAGCAGCAAGQVGQNGLGEITVSTGNRNFAGKQGQGEVYLTSPVVVAASAIAGVITLPNEIPSNPVLFQTTESKDKVSTTNTIAKTINRMTKFKGCVWVIKQDNIDTDMIFHNRYLTITDIDEMGQYTFDNLEGYKDFAKKAKPGDIVVTGKNFGAGSSRQQAVDCFESLGISMIIAESFGAIYERNAINKGYPIVRADLISEGLETNQEIIVDLETGVIKLPSDKEIKAGFSEVQINIYNKAGLLNK